MDKARIEQLTDTVMAAITDDVRSGVVPWTVTNFGQLHDWVDANMYLEHAGQQFDAGDPDSLEEVNAIEDEVSRRLGNGAVTGGGWRQITWTVQQSHSMVLPLALLREEHRDEPLTVGEVNDEAIAEFEGEATLVSQSSRTINRVDVVDAPAYVEPADRYSGASILDDPRLKLRTALAELRRLDAEAKRRSDQDHHDGLENAQDDVAEQANAQARAALRLALTLLGMTQASSSDAATRDVNAG
jgi:hypothetical protein